MDVAVIIDETKSEQNVDVVLLTQDRLVDLVADVEALGVSGVLQQEAVDAEALLPVLGSFQ